MIEEWKSQLGQDKAVDEILKGKTRGVFVDIGAHDGVTISNTWFFEKKRGWTGLCVEPLPARYKDLVKNRSNSQCWNGACVASIKEKEQNFLAIEGYSEMLSGLLDSYDPQHTVRIERENKQHDQKCKIIKVPVKTLADLLDEYKINQVDYLSIDVEGAELSVLLGLGIEKLKSIYLVTIEFNYENDDKKKILELLLNNGFRQERVLGGGYEILFLNERMKNSDLVVTKDPKDVIEKLFEKKNSSARIDIPVPLELKDDFIHHRKTIRHRNKIIGCSIFEDKKLYKNDIKIYWEVTQYYSRAFIAVNADELKEICRQLSKKLDYWCGKKSLAIKIPPVFLVEFKGDSLDIIKSSIEEFVYQVNKP